MFRQILFFTFAIFFGNVLSQLTAAQKQQFLDLHNQYRRTVKNNNYEF